ncbi:hypothetical protein E8E13_007185 [Curvularia kusanoi]|uniref:Uncharacterized protein n=1 Tax=Curvularia kusanoi TaxID=90978 RepID=A0A9P4W4K7_CURKU|nr:hypothetical protein E8E13_007185 [Curvularia kusanoi]
MAASNSRSHRKRTLEHESSQQFLRQLLSEVRGIPPSRTTRLATSVQLPIRALSQSPPIDRAALQWLDGPLPVPDVVEMPQAADTAPDEKERGARTEESPDPVKAPHDYLQHVLRNSPLSPTDKLSSGLRDHGLSPFHLQPEPFTDTVCRPVSPLIFSDISPEDFFSSTETDASTTQPPTSATTADTAVPSQSPETRKRAHLFDDMLADSSSQKRRATYVWDLQDKRKSTTAADDLCSFSEVAGDNQSILEHEEFIERAPKPSAMAVLSIDDAVPELSSFRPTDPAPRSRSGPSKSRPNKSRSKSQYPSSGSSRKLADTTLLQPMHLIDINGVSIYRANGGDGPLRNPLCLWCFRLRGELNKILSDGCTRCKRSDALEHLYWEDSFWEDHELPEDALPEDSEDPWDLGDEKGEEDS